jgi:ParB-like chromosome segregation protein Spo0J
MDENAEWVDIDRLKLWERNPRRNDRSAKRLAKKIKRHGFRVAVIAWRENMTVYVGNTRMKAARILGMTRVAVSFQDFESEADAIDFGLAENRSSEDAEWDDGKLVDLFEGELEQVVVTSEPTELDARTGFTRDEIEGLKSGWVSRPSTTTGPQGDKEPTTIRCPYCSEEFTLA